MMIMADLVQVQSFHNLVYENQIFSVNSQIFFVVNFNFLLTHAAVSHQSKGKPDTARLAIDMTQLTLKKMALGNRSPSDH